MFLRSQKRSLYRRLGGTESLLDGCVSEDSKSVEVQEVESDLGVVVGVEVKLQVVEGVEVW